MEKLRKYLAVFELLVGLSAAAGAVALLTTNGLGMPVDQLHGVFNSYVWPGLILGVIVGGTHGIAASLLWVRHPYAYEASATAGFGLLIWVFTELYIIRQPHLLQALYFGVGICTLVLVMIMLKHKEGKESTMV